MSKKSLAERLRQRAEALAPAPHVPVLLRVIEVRAALAEQRTRGVPWQTLAGLLAMEGVHISPGTLRNYMSKIGRAEAELRRAGRHAPSDADIHRALRRGGPEPGPITTPPTPPHPMPVPPAGPPGDRRAPARPAFNPVPRGSLSRDPDRAL
jgi:hypothetical protein